MPRFAAFSRKRLEDFPKVRIEINNSVDGLKEITEDFSKVTLFYLDAHWYDYLPLRDEYLLIREKFPKAVIVIDDFKVPHDEVYTYDDYGPDMALTLEYMQPAFDKAPAIFFPNVPAKYETGERRGCVVMTTNSDLAAIIAARIALLRKWEA